MLTESFIQEVVALALQIARRVRNEDHLQSVDILIDKFFAECKEADHAENIWDEIPDLVYYAVCLLYQGNDTCWYLMHGYLSKHQITREAACAACLAKYRLRAAGHPKNIEVERAAIMAAIEAL